jgi:hypothetical protein
MKTTIDVPIRKPVGTRSLPFCGFTLTAHFQPLTPRKRIIRDWGQQGDQPSSSSIGRRAYLRPGLRRSNEVPTRIWSGLKCRESSGAGIVFQDW